MKEIEELWTALQSELTVLDKEKDTIRRLELSGKATIRAIERLEEVFASRGKFDDDPDALINFNRSLAPRFYAKFIFISKVLAFECLKKDMYRRESEELYDEELADIRRFFELHLAFRSYCLRGATSHDALYYQNGAHNTIQLDDLIVGISPDVNKGCLLASYIQAFEEYRSYLEASRQEWMDPTLDPDLKWVGKPSDLNELAIALEGYIYKRNRPATLKEITQAIGKLLQVDLSNNSQLDNKRRNRLAEGPTFLEKLAAESNKRKNKLIENQKSRKRRG